MPSLAERHRFPLSTMGDRTQILHVAQSLFQDVAQAGALGLDTVWTRRDHNAARLVEAKPTSSHPTLGDSADANPGGSA